MSGNVRRSLRHRLTHPFTPLNFCDAILFRANPSGSSPMNRRPSILIIFLTVFIDLVGFGIVVPMVPLYSRHYGANGFVLGAIFSSYSAMQFIFAPIWGRWSDRFGRRPMLLFSTAGAALSYVLFAFASGLPNHT